MDEKLLAQKQRGGHKKSSRVSGIAFGNPTFAEIPAIPAPHHFSNGEEPGENGLVGKRAESAGARIQKLGQETAEPTVRTAE
jgi:hypothetical protein